MNIEDIRSKIICDYSSKLTYKIPNYINKVDINNLLMFLNFCFLTKNNFFIENFNNKEIYHIYKIYNKIKSNILDDTKSLFSDLNDYDIKLLKFILSNLITNFDIIFAKNTQEILYLKTLIYNNKNGFKNIIKYLKDINQ